MRMLIDSIPREARELLQRSDRPKFRHRRTGTTIWTFGQWKANGDGDTGQVLLPALTLGNYADSLPDEFGIPVAQSEDGDLLAIDVSAARGVMIVRHEDMAIEPLHETIADWLLNSESCDFEVPDEKFVQVPSQLLGRWRAIDSPDLSNKVVSRLPEIELTRSGEWTCHWTWPESTIEPGRFVLCRDTPNRIIVVDEDGDKLSYHVEVCDDDKIILVGPDSPHRVVYTRVEP